MTAAELQALFDSSKVGEGVVISGTHRLDRPLLLARDRLSLSGLGRACLRTTGAFPAVLVSPPTRRWPGFPGRHRLAQGLDLSDAVLRLRASPFERVGGASQLTLCALLSRKGDSWGTSNTAPVICTDSDRLGSDPYRLAVSGSSVMLDFRTDDGGEHRAWFARPIGDTLRLAILIDGVAGMVGAWINGQFSSPGTDAALKPGSRLAHGDFPDLQVGRDPYSGQGNYVLGGLRVCRRLALPWGGPLPEMTDAAMFGPSSNALDAALDFSVPALGPDDPLVWWRMGSRRGCGLLTPAKWDPYDSTDGVEVRNLDIEVTDRDYGSGLMFGPCLDLRVTDCRFTGGARGVDQMLPVVSYTTRLDGLRFRDQSEAALVLGKGACFTTNCAFGRGPSRNQVRIHSAGGVLERFSMPEHPMPAPIAVKEFGSDAAGLAIRDGMINYESFGPDCYFDVGRGNAGAGLVATLAIEGVEVGGAPPKLAVVRLRDDAWKGRTDKVGSARVVARRSFSLMPGATLFRGLSPAWAAEADGVKAAEDVTNPAPAAPTAGAR